MNSSFMRLAFCLLMCSILGFGVWVYTRPTSLAQTDRLKKVEEAYSSNPQVRVTKLKVGAETRRFLEEFEESDDWPQRLSLEIENISTKPIVYLQVNLNFPETKSSGSMMSFGIQLGIRPDLHVPKNNEPLHLLPGENKTIAVGDYYGELERFIRHRHTMNQLRKAQIEIGFIIFEDLTAWTAGEFYRPDPNKIGRYLPIRNSSSN